MFTEYLEGLLLHEEGKDEGLCFDIEEGGKKVGDRIMFRY